MTTSYPAGYDSYTDKINNVSTVLATSVNNLQDAMAALEVLVGKVESGVDTTWTYRTQNFFEEGVLTMYFFQPVAPIGWTTQTLASACAIAIKGGGQYDVWNIDGGQYYDVYQPGGSSGYDWRVDDMIEDGHRHRWYDEQGGIPYVYDVDGVSLVTTVTVNENAGCPMNNIQKGSDYRDNYDSGYYTWTAYHTHDFQGGWRPRAAVGIVAQYTGA